MHLKGGAQSSTSCRKGPERPGFARAFHLLRTNCRPFTVNSSHFLLPERNPANLTKAPPIWSEAMLLHLYFELEFGRTLASNGKKSHFLSREKPLLPKVHSTSSRSKREKNSADITRTFFCTQEPLARVIAFFLERNPLAPLQSLPMKILFN